MKSKSNIKKTKIMNLIKIINHEIDKIYIIVVKNSYCLIEIFKKYNNFL